MNVIACAGLSLPQSHTEEDNNPDFPVPIAQPREPCFEGEAIPRMLRVGIAGTDTHPQCEHFQVLALHAKGKKQEDIEYLAWNQKRPVRVALTVDTKTTDRQ